MKRTVLRISLFSAALALLLFSPLPVCAQEAAEDDPFAQETPEIDGAEDGPTGDAASDDDASDPDDATSDDEAADTDASVAITDDSGLVRSRREGMQDKWGDKHAMYRDARAFVSWWKLLLVLLLFLFWIKTCDWVNRASQIFNLGYAKWNAIVVFCGLTGLLVVLYVPMFVATMPVYAALVLGPFIAFSIVHNKSVQQHQRVFTGDWWRHSTASVANKFGAKWETEKKADYEKGPPVDLIAQGADDRGNQANLMTARLSPGYVLVKELIADMTSRRSDRVLLDYSQDAVAVRHFVDGVWEAGEPRDRDSGDVMLAVMKQLANLNVKERQKKQQGEFHAKFNGADFKCPVTSQGVKTGERVLVSLQSSNSKLLDTYAELGMRDKLAEQWAEMLIQPGGLLLISAMPEGGLTTLTDVSLLETDRLMRDVFSIEPKDAPERDIENIQPQAYDRIAGETPATLMPALVRRYPDMYVARDFVDEASAAALLAEANDEKLVVTTIRAKEAAEAMLRVLQKKAPRKEFAKAIVSVINTRLIRKLCPECRVAYDASPELLKKLGIPAGKVTQLYRVPTAEEIQKPCPKCGGSGYFGRTGLFELLVVNDQVREALLKDPKLDTVRRAARSAGMRTLQEEGVLLVAKGTTSLQELQRVLKQ